MNLSFVRKVLVFPIIAKSHLGMSQASVAIFVDGPVVAFSDKLEDAKPSGEDQYRVYLQTQNMRWANMKNQPNYKMRTVERGEDFEHLVAEAYYDPDSPKSAGGLERSLDFTLAGRSPNETYIVTAQQTFSAKTPERHVTAPQAYSGITIYCLNTPSVDLSGAQSLQSPFTWRSEFAFGKWFSDQTTSLAVTILPGSCPSNSLRMVQYFHGVQDLILKPFSLGILTIRSN